MRNLRFCYLLATGLLIFQGLSIGQMADFSRVPNLYEGDSLGIVTLIKNGIEIKKGKAVCWFPKDSLSEERMREIADTMSIGITAVEKFIKAPLPWQIFPITTVYTFYFRDEFFISHASLAGFVSVPFWRIKTGKSPWLHEILHDMLFNKGGNWWQKDLAEEYFMKNMPLWISEGLPDYISLEVSRQNKLPRFDVFSFSNSLNVDSMFLQDMKSEKSEYIISYIGGRGVIPELSSKDRQQYAPCFYHGSCSFVQFIANRYGLEVLLNAISSFQKEHDVIETQTGKSISELKKDWLQQLNASQ